MEKLPRKGSGRWPRGMGCVAAGGGCLGEHPRHCLRASCCGSVTTVGLGVSDQPALPSPLPCHRATTSPVPCPVAPVPSPGVRRNERVEMNGAPVPSAAAAVCPQEEKKAAKLILGEWEWIPPTPELLCRSCRKKARSNFFLI